MFDLGFWELILIGIVGLLVIGPDRLPAFARETGRWLRRLRRLTSEARRELQRELQWNEDEDPRRDMNQLKNELDQKMDDLDQLMKKAPDRQPGWQSDYTAGGARKPTNKPEADAAESRPAPPDDDTGDDPTRDA